MKMQEAQTLILDELKKNNSITPKELHQNTKVALIQIYGILKHLEGLSIISHQVTDTGKVYQVVNKKGLDTAFEVDSTSPIKTEQKPKVEIGKIGRDTSKFIFQKIPYSKSKCVLMVVSDYIKKNNPTLKQLKETFPDKIVSKFGVVEILKTAQDYSTDRPRYYLKEHHILSTKDKNKVVICNQWTLTRFIDFMEVAARLGYKIKPE